MKQMTVKVSADVAAHWKRQKDLREMMGLNTSDSAMLGDMLAEYVKRHPKHEPTTDPRTRPL
jgi:hypothetical protein